MTILYHNTIQIEQKTSKQWELLLNWRDYRTFWLQFPFGRLNIIQKHDYNADGTCIKICENNELDISNIGFKQLLITANYVDILPNYIKLIQNTNCYLDYAKCLDLVKNLGEQLKSLERNMLATPFIDLNDILVIDEEFYYINAQRILPIKKTHIPINELYQSTNQLFSPEFKKINYLPNHLHSKSMFYSLGRLIILLLFKKCRNTIINADNKSDNKSDDKSDNDTDNDTDMNAVSNITIKTQYSEPMQYLEQIRSTKLYWILQRLIDPNPDNRFYLMI